MLSRLQQAFGEEVLTLLLRLGDAADDCAVPSHLIGGPVRDALLNLRATDLDVMVEGDAPAFARYLKEHWRKYRPGGPDPKSVAVFRRYQTAKLLFSAPLCDRILCLDFSSARKETYPSPGARPLVSPGTLSDDLQRRDFSINAMAVCLSAARRGTVSDYFNGRRDLARRELNVLHELSFRDDPARLIRALRFTTRFGFVMGDATQRLFAAAVAGEFLSRIPRMRLFDEFRKALCERELYVLVSELSTTGLLGQISPALELSGSFRQYCQALPHAPGGGHGSELWQQALGHLVVASNDQEYAQALSEMGAPKQLIGSLVQARRWGK